ncbi:MAG: radical SAM protein, partial [Planctomycetaceae bacterium]
MKNTDVNNLIRDHRRQWRECLYVYPVIARRSRGMSIGINLNPRMECTFACAYCQVDRSVPRGLSEVQLPILRDELLMAMTAAANGGIWREERFRAVPKRLRRVNDIAFSGDGEPTCMKNFDVAVQTAADIKKQMNLADVKIVVITNATQFRSSQFTRALPILDANNGEIWAKLDAGTEEYFQRVNHPAGGITLDSIVDDIAAVAGGRPIVIQTLFMLVDGMPPSEAEIKAYTRRLRKII